ncbi:hypothetical protein J2T55_000678 [Methylohalomonas lacus]|uniref:Uncharacterized protein n=1 Tax=Methylohalomonas lacus TaxID=398773 RepID=A0AAE3HI11_9GAMM|nr:DUF6165 family protein [Methylohalomonas lacus]MCS3902674.1 hypothetical protein [Methylohalomonas lacus]
MAEIMVPISPGELVDKITILQIKSERITDADKLRNVAHELGLLRETWQASAFAGADIEAQTQSLKSINEALWDIEDNIRLKEAAAAFDAEFIELARSVYFTNDKRARVKREINELLGSKLIEEKSYQDYSH